MLYLIDSNIFLEILLLQPAKERCKKFLQDNKAQCSISDFSLHTIGVILLYHHQEKVYSNFLQDVLPELQLLHLPVSEYDKIVTTRLKYNLDFDDAYQYSIAQQYNLEVVTMDNDFKRVQNNIKIKFI